MILTPNASCTQIVVQSDAFSLTNTSNELVVTINNSQEITVTPTASATSYTITAGALSLEELPSGVYSIKLTSVRNDTTVKTDLGCTTLLCAYMCDEDRLNLYTSTDNIEKILAFEGLVNFQSCVSCSCDLANILHDAYLNNQSTNAGSCSCK